MSASALPPDLSTGAGYQHTGGQSAIFYGMPLGGKGWVSRGEIVFPGDYRPILTDGAAAAGCSGLDLCLPLMPLFGSATRLSYGCRAQPCPASGLRFFWDATALPNSRDLRRLGLFAGTGALSGTAGAARAIGPGVYCGLPTMSALTLPPDFLPAAIGNGLGRQWRILLRVPLLQHTG